MRTKNLKMNLSQPLSPMTLWTQRLSPKRLALSPKRLALSRMSRVLIEKVYFSVLELNFRPYNTHQKTKKNVFAQK